MLAGELAAAASLIQQMDAVLEVTGDTVGPYASVALVGDRGDLLSMLLQAVDPEDPTDTMSNQQVRDECLTIILAGHETTANALSFALWNLAQHQDIQTFAPQLPHLQSTYLFINFRSL